MNESGIHKIQPPLACKLVQIINMSTKNITNFQSSDSNQSIFSQSGQIDAENINVIFHQIKNGVHNLLEQTAMIYKNYGIVYPTQQYFDAILRMLAPVDLHAFFNRGPMLEHKAIDSRKESQKKGVSTCLLQTKNKNKSQIKRDFQKSGNSVKLIRRLEEKILPWILSQLQDEKIVTKYKIMCKAKELGKNFDFKAYSSWCNSFLDRNPDVKSIIYKRLYLQDSSIKTNPLISSKNRKNQQQYEDLQFHADIFYSDQLNKMSKLEIQISISEDQEQNEENCSRSNQRFSTKNN